MSTNSDVKILQPNGILTGATIPALMHEFSQCLEARAKHVLIDLSEVDFIDSYGLGMLVSMHAKIRLASGKIYLCAPKDQARCLFEIADMDRLFDIFETRSEFYRTVINQNQAVLVE